MPSAAAALDLSNPPPGFFDDPWPHYARLRETPIAADGRGGLVLSRYRDVAAVYRDPVAFTSDKRAEFRPKFGDGSLFAHHTTSLVFNDGARHGRVRRRLVGALTPKAVSRLAVGLAPFCDRMADELLRDGGGDALEGFAAAVPVRIIGDLLGLPEQDRAPLRGWSLAILGALEPTLSARLLRDGNAAVGEFGAYLEHLIADRRRRPGDPDTDLLTRMLAVGDDALSPAELVHNAIFLLNAGHETTTNLIASALVVLASDPGAAESCTTEAFIEEVLRLESPNQLGNRAAARDAKIGDTPVEEGTRLTLVIGAANRDPDMFADADRFVPSRSPNRHLAFGAGPHQCAGLSLARMEARVALDAWRRRIPSFRLAGRPVRQRRIRFRGFQRLAITL